MWRASVGRASRNRRGSRLPARCRPGNRDVPRLRAGRVPEWAGFRADARGPSRNRRVSRPARRARPGKADLLGRPSRNRRGSRPAARRRPGMGGFPRGCARAVPESPGFSPGEKGASRKRGPSPPAVPEWAGFPPRAAAAPGKAPDSRTQPRRSRGRSPFLGRPSPATGEIRRFRDGPSALGEKPGDSGITPKSAQKYAMSLDFRRARRTVARVGASVIALCGVSVSDVFPRRAPTGAMVPLGRFVSDWCKLADEFFSAARMCARRRARLFSWLRYSPTQRRSRSSGPRP